MAEFEKRCTACGSAARQQDRFCSNCGASDWVEPSTGDQSLVTEDVESPAPTGPQSSDTQGSPQAVDHNRQARDWAVFTHVAAVAGFFVPFGWILGPLIIWLMKRDEFQFVDEHGKAALNFFISITIWGTILSAVLLPLVLLLRMAFAPFFALAIGFSIAMLALTVIAVAEVIINAGRASRGEQPYYHISLTLIR